MTAAVIPVYTGSMLKPEPWTQEALCAQADPDAWFPEKGDPAMEVRRICRRCPVIDECAEYAVRTRQEHGIWGGESAQVLNRRAREGAVA